MQIRQFLNAAPLALAIMAFIAPVANAQQDFHTRGAKDAAPKKNANDAPAAQFPNATRAEPKAGVSAEMEKPINDLLALVNGNKSNDEVIAQGEKLAATKNANHYERSVVFQAIGFAYLNKGDNAKGIDYLQQALTENGLSNNDHYQLMLQVSKSQIAAGQTDAGLATLDRVIAETKQDKPDYAAIRARVQYEKKDYAAAVQAFQKALDAGAQLDSASQQMLMASYIGIKQPERAEKIGEDILRAHPDDKNAITNLATVYQDAQQPEKAAALLDDARKKGLFTDADDYRSLYATYSNIKGHEKDSIAVINEGLQKGILQPNAEVYTILAEDYYFSDQTPQAIEAYKKADAVSTDGEAALSLAKVYNNTGRPADAKAAAEHALQKGIKHPAEAHGIIDRAGAGARKPAKKK